MGTSTIGSGDSYIDPSTGAGTFTTLSASGTASFGAGQLVATRVVTASGAVTVTSADYVIVVNKASGASTAVNLPAGVTKTVFIIKDGKGDAASNNITVTPASGNIDGAATYVINTNYGSVTIVFNGSQWNII